MHLPEQWSQKMSTWAISQTESLLAFQNRNEQWQCPSHRHHRNTPYWHLETVELWFLEVSECYFLSKQLWHNLEHCRYHGTWTPALQCHKMALGQDLKRISYKHCLFPDFDSHSVEMRHWSQRWNISPLHNLADSNCSLWNHSNQTGKKGGYQSTNCTKMQRLWI